MIETWTTNLPLLFAAVCLALILRQEMRIARLQRQLSRPDELGRQVAALAANVDAMLRCNRGIDDMLHEHHRQIRQLQDRQDGLEMQDSGLSRYRQAVTLVTRGADQNDLISTCGLSRGEAELVAHLNRLQRRAS